MDATSPSRPERACLLPKSLGLGALAIALLLVSRLHPAGARPSAEADGVAPSSHGVAAQVASTPTPTPDPRFRFGFGIDLNVGELDEYDVSQLGAGWYSDWFSQASPPRPACLEYAQMICTQGIAVDMDARQISWGGWAGLEQAISANPGSIWMIGNEPDAKWPDCDNHLPEAYAIIYHEFYHFIKDRDPTALVANGAIVQGTPLRLQYLDMVWDAYQTFYGTAMPVDVWNMHNQIAREKEGDWGAGIPPGFPPGTVGALYTAEQNDSLDIFIQHIVNMRTWMKDHGQRDKPLIVSEYGVLFIEDKGFTVDRVNDFMTNTFRYLLYATDADLGYPADGNRLVQRWLWLGINMPPWKWNGALFDYTIHAYPGVITRYGMNYKAFLSNPYKASPTPQGTPPPETVYREAEGGSLSGDMRIVADTSASGCEYVDTPSDSAGGSVQVSVYIPRSSTYYVWARVYGPSINSDSFWVSVDQGTEYVLGTGTGSWKWQRVVDEEYALVAFQLNPGWHRIKVRQREVGARVDAVVISSNSGLVPVVPTVCQTPTPTASPTPQPSLDIPLQPGWNLVSLPLDPPDYDVRALLASIDGSYSIVHAWDGAAQAWKTFSPELPDPQALQSLGRLQGFWVYMNQADTLQVTGCQQGQATILLNPGWNLVGFPAGSVQDVSTALSSIEGKYDLVYAFDAANPGAPWSRYKAAAPSYANDLSALEPGKGYWIRATQACAWVIPH